MRRVAGIILFNSNNEILLQHRTNDAPIYPGKWGFFGGHIENGENPLEAVKRECKEELNYSLKNPNHILSHIIDELNMESLVFIEKYDNSKELILNEGQAMKWFSIKDIDNLDMPPGFKEIVFKVFEKISKL